MKEKSELYLVLDKEYNECLVLLNKIGFDISDIGIITIKISSKNYKRYGCCRQEEPDVSTKYIEKVGRKKYIKYAIYKKHTIEISPWVFELSIDVLRNTLMHEIIHCMPYCNNHGKEFKKYAKYINDQLGYKIETKGNKEKDYLESNMIFKEKSKNNYQIICEKCGYFFNRIRINVDYEKRYRCGKCGGRLKVKKVNNI